MTTDISKPFYLLGTPLTSFNGRITRNARNDLTSKPCTSYLTNITLKNLSYKKSRFFALKNY
jgi:hypothetical protein